MIARGIKMIARPIRNVITDEQAEEIKQELELQEKLFGKPLSKEEKELNQINLYKKMTDYGMLDHNKFITIVITYSLGRYIVYTTAVVRETFVVTYDFCYDIFKKHMGNTYYFGYFYYGIKDSDIIDMVDNGIAQLNYETSISPITQYSNIKNIKENYVYRGKIYEDDFYEFHEF